MNRRDFTRGVLASVTSFALLESLYAFNALDQKVQPIVDHWSIWLNEYCQDLRKDKITQLEWQNLTEELFNKIDLTELTEFIDFDKLIKGFEFPDLGVSTEMVNFPKLDGLPENTAYVKKVFGMKKDRAIIPHGHSNMASSHLILKGEMHLRHYDKLRKEEDNLIIKPTLDKIVRPGESSSVSDDHHNVHWFIANTETAFTFDVIMLDLKGQHYDIHNLDIYESEDLKDGSLKVPILDVQTALKKYGKHHH